jgi:hypothetical protein
LELPIVLIAPDKIIRPMIVSLNELVISDIALSSNWSIFYD